MSRSDPPTVDILRAALVMKVRRPLWLEQPEKPRSRYQREKRLTIAWGEVRVVRLRRDHERGRAASGRRLAQAQKGRPQLSVEGDDPAAALALAGVGCASFFL
jgi:hypothetical protein